MKKRKLTACLLAGVLVLAVSDGAAYGSVNGYTAYKNGVKALVKECNNVSLAGSVRISIDGKEVVNSREELITDGANQATHTWEGTGDQPSYESHSVTINGVNTYYSSGMEPQTYRTHAVPKTEVTPMIDLLGEDADELERRLTTFLELAADTDRKSVV